MNDLACREFVELVTGFLDDSLDAGTERRFVEHLAGCDGCEHYLDQFRQTVRTLGDAPAESPEALPEDTRNALLDAFRNRRA